MEVWILGSGGVMKAVALGCPYGIGKPSRRFKRNDCTATIDMVYPYPFILAFNYARRAFWARCGACDFGEPFEPCVEEKYTWSTTPLRRMDLCAALRLRICIDLRAAITPLKWCDPGKPRSRAW